MDSVLLYPPLLYWTYIALVNGEARSDAVATSVINQLGIVVKRALSKTHVVAPLSQRSAATARAAELGYAIDNFNISVFTDGAILISDSQTGAKLLVIQFG